jgi:multidrug efflux system outer membrane protein
VRRITFLLCALLLAGCAGDRPDAPSQARVAAPAAWRNSAMSGSQPGPEWWKTFDDGRLDQLVEQALANNIDIATASVRVAEARARFRLARAERLPDVLGALAGGRQADVSPFGLPQYQSAGQGDIEVVFDADLFGRLAEANAAARSELLATQAAQATVQLAVAASTASAYINLSAARAKLEILRATLNARSESLKYASSRVQAGYAPQLDLRQAESEYHATEQLIPATKLAISQLEDGLSILLGEAPDDIAAGEPLKDIQVPSVPATLPSALLRQRPDIIAAEEQVVAADHSLDSARAAFMPDVELSASGGYAASSIIPAPVKIFQLGGSILAPIFESGRLHAQQDVAVAKRDEAAYAYRKAVLTAFREVDDGLAAQTRLQQEEQSIAAQRDALSKSLVLATNRYRAGYSSYLEQIDAERSLQGADLQLIEVHAQRLVQTVSLYQALGGGWVASDHFERAASDIGPPTARR